MKKLLLTVLILLGVFLSGCSMLGGGTDTKTSGLFGSGSSSSGSGGSGVTLEFGDSNIQPQKGYDFSILINLKNYQLHEVNDLQIKPDGFDWGYVNGLKKSYSEKLSKATESGPSQKALYLEGIKLDGFEDNYDFDPIFKYCYTAQTQFFQQICVPNSFGQCDLSVDSSSSQNGPLKVSVDKIYPLGENAIGLELSVSNSLGGNVVNDCFQAENKMEFGNAFTLRGVKLGSDSGNCKPTSADKYVINNNGAKFFCEFSRGGDEAYRSQVTVELEYKYQQQKQKSITIRDLTVN